MKPFCKMRTQLCSLIFFFTCLLLCGILAWKIGEANAVTSVWVAREKIVGAEPYTTVEQIHVGRGLLFGVPVFLIGGLFSYALTALYDAALRFFRGSNAPQ